jgi:hypothetical protein
MYLPAAYVMLAEIVRMVPAQHTGPSGPAICTDHNGVGGVMVLITLFPRSSAPAG